MTTEALSRAPAVRSGGAFAGFLFYACQFLFGGWFLYHGSNHWAHWFAQPPGHSGLSHEFIKALIDTGLFNLVKAIEVVVGIALLANRFVPLAVVMAFPVTLVIAYDNLFINGDSFSHITGIVIIAVNALIGIGHLDRFLPMLAYRTEDPGLRGLGMLFGGR